MKISARIIVLLEALLFLPLIFWMALGLIGVISSVLFGWFGIVWFLVGIFIIGCTTALFSLIYFAATNGNRILRAKMALFFSVCGLVLLGVFSWISGADRLFIVPLVALAHMIYLCRSYFVADAVPGPKPNNHGQ